MRRALPALAAIRDKSRQAVTTEPGPARRQLEALAGRPDDRTLDQVRRQLRGFGCEKYEVQPLPPKGRDDLKPERIRTWDSATIERSIGWLRRMNAQGYDIYLRPAPRTDGTAEPLAFVDDVNADQVEQMKARGLAPAVLIESSPGRYHGWVRVASHPVDRHELTAACKILAQDFGGDPSSADWRHYGRLAGFTNQKPSRRTERGQPFAQLRADSRDIAPGGEDLLAHATQELEWQAKRKAQERAERERSRAFSGGSTALQDAASAFIDARNRAQGKDESSRDFSAALSMLRRGYDEAQVRAAILQASPGLDERHRNPDDYVLRTVNKAADMIRGDNPTLKR